MPHEKQIRRAAVIGANIRKGQTPGGFSSALSPGRNTERNTRVVVHRAATAFLNKRGIASPTFEGEAFGEKLSARKTGTLEANSAAPRVAASPDAVRPSAPL